MVNNFVLDSSKLRTPCNGDFLLHMIILIDLRLVGRSDYDFFVIVVTGCISARWLGGHKAYPKKRDVKVLVYADRLVIEKGLDIEIPFESISNIENSDAQRITKTRVLLTGVIVGLLWKKKFLYTVIDYNDGIVDQTMMIELWRRLKA
jgi:hypothetical protein